MKKLLFPLLLIQSVFPARSQTFSTGKVCFTPTQAGQIADSLHRLPVVRQQVADWRGAAGYFRTAADSTRAALGQEKKLTTSETARADRYQRKSRVRGVLNVVLTALLVGLTALAISR